MNRVRKISLFPLDVILSIFYFFTTVTSVGVFLHHSSQDAEQRTEFISLRTKAITDNYLIPILFSYIEYPFFHSLNTSISFKGQQASRTLQGPKGSQPWLRWPFKVFYLSVSQVINLFVTLFRGINTLASQFIRQLPTNNHLLMHIQLS